MTDIPWNDDQFFFTYEWWDETSQFDDHPSKRWVGGSEYYERLFKIRVPLGLKDSPDGIERWIDWWLDTEEEGFWVED